MFWLKTEAVIMPNKRGGGGLYLFAELLNYISATEA
jgi:hypothetical protein